MNKLPAALERDLKNLNFESNLIFFRLHMTTFKQFPVAKFVI